MSKRRRAEDDDRYDNDYERSRPKKSMTATGPGPPKPGSYIPAHTFAQRVRSAESPHLIHTAPPAMIDWGAMLDVLDAELVKQILVTTMLSSDLASTKQAIHQSYSDQIQARAAANAEETKRVIDFSSYSRDAWYTLNKTYKSSMGSVEYTSAFTAAEEVRDCIESIRSQVVSTSSFGTKSNALENLRKIGKSIALAGSTLGSEVRKGFQGGTCLESAMIEIVNRMEPDDIREAAESADEKGRFVDKVEELLNLTSGLCIMDRLADFIDILYCSIEGSECDSEDQEGSGSESEDDEEGESESKHK